MHLFEIIQSIHPVTIATISTQVSLAVRFLRHKIEQQKPVPTLLHPNELKICIAFESVAPRLFRKMRKLPFFESLAFFAMSKLSSYSTLFLHLLAGFFLAAEDKGGVVLKSALFKTILCKNISRYVKPYVRIVCVANVEPERAWLGKVHQLMNPAMISFLKKPLQTFLSS